MKIDFINPFHLTVHSELLRIYSDNNLDLQDDIKKNRIIVPLIASTRTSRPIVVSGNRRLQAAIVLGIETVPVVY